MLRPPRLKQLTIPALLPRLPPFPPRFCYPPPPRFKAAALEMLVAQAGIVGWTASSEDVAKALAAC